MVLRTGVESFIFIFICYGSLLFISCLFSWRWEYPAFSRTHTVRSLKNFQGPNARTAYHNKSASNRWMIYYYCIRRNSSGLVSSLSFANNNSKQSDRRRGHFSGNGAIRIFQPQPLRWSGLQPPLRMRYWSP